MKVCFTGDLFLGGDLNGKPASEAVQSTVFHDADIRVTNLEQPISDTINVAEKCTLYTGSYAVTQLQHLKIGIANLANNHIHDKGLEGIGETADHLTKGGIAFFGGGRNIAEARAPVFITDNVVVLGYCDYDQPYLKQVAVAGEEKPGINPLRLENIMSDLENLPSDKMAILYLHWGREHVWFPPYKNLMIARQLLRHEKVMHVIGMHAHRIQGYLCHGKKRAYMCLGNFLFPNFYIRPPTHVDHSCEPNESFDTTRQYHGVTALTYKKWQGVNRQSLLVTVDTATGQIRHDFVSQHDDLPAVNDTTKKKALALKGLIALVSLVYRAPKPVYIAVETSFLVVHAFFWRMGILAFRFKQEGLSATFRIIIRKMQER